VYGLQVRKRRGHIFFEWNKCLWQHYLKQNGKFSDVSTEFLDMKYSNKQSAAVYNYIIFFAYLWSFRWPNYIVTLPRYFSFRLPHLNISTWAPPQTNWTRILENVVEIFLSNNLISHTIFVHHCLPFCPSSVGRSSIYVFWWSLWHLIEIFVQLF
jgi:hypothetical protein